MSTRKLSLALVQLLALLATTTWAQQEAPMSWVSEMNERRLSHDGRQIEHMHLHTTPLYGNSTDFMYYYITVYFGSHRQPQTLIVDTGSSVAAIPCKEFCASGKCGKHINQLYESSQSDHFSLYSCKQVDCHCTTQERCRFYQGYAEGSRYEGFIAKDALYFGENSRPGVDLFEYTFGCVQTETKYFYSQDADGILGLSAERPGMNVNRFEPIYDVMKEQNIIEERVFSMCLGKNGGYFQIGGYDQTGHLVDMKRNNNRDVHWLHLMHRDNDFKVPFRGISMNNHQMGQTQTQTVAFIDSGTTFTYLNQANFKAIELHFRWFCSLDPVNHCKGKINFQRQGYMCFSYDEKEFPDGPYDYFRSFPILRFDIGTEAEDFTLDWYPSEYLYREKAGRYCVAIDLQNGNEMIIGGSIMRQHNFVFDLDQQRVGIARATCNHDANQVKHEEELLLAGQTYALDPLHVESTHQIKCDHVAFQQRPARQPGHEPDPQPRLIVDPEDEPEIGPPTVQPNTSEIDTTEVEKAEDVELAEDEEPIDGQVAEQPESQPVEEPSNPVFEPEKPAPQPDLHLPTEVKQDDQIGKSKPDYSTHDHESDLSYLDDKYHQELSLDEIKQQKNGDSSSSKKTIPHSEQSGSGAISAFFFVFVFVVIFTVVACYFLITRYCKGRGVSEGGAPGVVDPRRIDREYSQSSQRDATHAVPSYTEELGVSITSGRRSRANVRSDRSGDAYKLELQPDSQERQVPSLEDGDDDEYDEEEYTPESAEEEQDEEEEEEEEDEQQNNSQENNYLQEELDQAQAHDNRV